MCRQSHTLMAQGLSESEIVVALLGPEDRLAKISKFNISKGNLIRQAMLYNVKD